MESYSDKLKSEYLDFIYHLGNSKIYGKSVIDILQIRDNLSFWWMTLLAEKSNWAKSPNITNILKLMALRMYISNNECKEILIKTDNKDLINSIRLFCKNTQIKLEVLSSNSKIFFIKISKKKIYNTLYILKGMLWLIRESLFSIPFSIFRVKNQKLSTSKLIFVSYISSVKIDEAKDEKFNNIFWGPLPNYLEKNKLPLIGYIYP